MHLLFYSPYCEPSKQFIFFLQKSGMDLNFNKIDVSRDSLTGERPDIIKEYSITGTPTIVVENIMHRGEDAFLWLEYQIDKSCGYIPPPPSYTNPDKEKIDKYSTIIDEPPPPPYSM